MLCLTFSLLFSTISSFCNLRQSLFPVIVMVGYFILWKKVIYPVIFGISLYIKKKFGQFWNPQFQESFFFICCATFPAFLRLKIICYYHFVIYLVHSAGRELRVCLGWAVVFPSKLQTANRLTSRYTVFGVEHVQLGSEKKNTNFSSAKSGQSTQACHVPTAESPTVYMNDYSTVHKDWDNEIDYWSETAF